MGGRGQGSTAGEVQGKPSLRRQTERELADQERLLHDDALELEQLRSALLTLEVEASRYRALFELAPEPYLLTDRDGRITNANQAARQLLGIAETARSGLVSMLGDLAQGRAVGAVIARAASAREPVAGELRITGPGGDTRVVDARVVAHRRDQDLELGWLLRDMSDARRAADDLRSHTQRLERVVDEHTGELERAGEAVDLERARLAVLVEQLPAAVLVVAATSGELTLANQLARDLLLAGREGVVPPFATLELVEGDGRPVAPERGPIVQALDGKTLAGERFTFTGHDRTRRTIEVSAAPLRDRTGEIVAGIVVAQDVTDRERRERAEREFLSNAAHQLRTPVAAIQSAVDVLRSGGQHDLEARERFLGHIVRASDRLGQLSQSLLVLARSQAGEIARKEVVELSTLLRDLAQAIHPPANVAVKVRCRRDLVVLASRELLLEAIASLLENAVRYTREGEIVLRARRHGGRDVIVEVADTGVGMTPEVRERVFERFYAGAVAGSFGLGLAIAAQAAEAMGAELDVHSEPGVGTSVRLKLPAGTRRSTA